MEALRRAALELGASDAQVIPVADLAVDPRVRWKCMIPKCYMSGRCSHCPPHGFSVEEVREAVSAYEQAVFFRVGVKSSIIAAPTIAESMATGVIDGQGSAFNLGGHYMLVFTIVKLLGKRARQMGCRSTLGFAAGNCRDTLCHVQPTCQKLMTRRGCRHPNLSSPSLEASGFDVFRMAARVGWDVYPIGSRCRPESVPQGSLFGLVLAA